MSSILEGRQKAQSVRYALDSQLDLKEGLMKRELEKAMEGHILEEVKEDYIVLKNFFKEGITYLAIQYIESFKEEVKAG